MSDSSQKSSTKDTRPYSGYHNRPVQSSEDFITQVGPGTPGGEYLRRYWHPFLIASELKELPIPVRLLGEDLVVFRDLSGGLGLLHRHCIHRGTSLEYGIVANKGIRCCYHGWHFDVDGRVIDTPAEPLSSKIKVNFVQGAYLIKEWMGLLFAYMGPVDKVPELPIYDCVDNPEDNQPVPFRMQVPCNWVQIVENGADPIHNAYLHAIVAGQQFSEAFRVLPQLDFPETPLGFLSMATRKVGDYIFIRASDIILPNFGQFPNGANRVEKQSVGLRPFLTRWSVPVDDQNSFYMGFAHLNSYNSSVRKMSKEDFGVDRIPFIGQTGDRPYFERQREPGDYDAVVTQGAVANRKSEHLGTTDRGVVLFRRMLAKAIRDTQEGIQPEKPMLYSNSKVKTYCHEIVVKAPAGVDFSDSQKLAEFGRCAALSFVEFDHLSPKEREESVTKRVQDMINAWPVGPK